MQVSHQLVTTELVLDQIRPIRTMTALNLYTKNIAMVLRHDRSLNPTRTVLPSRLSEKLTRKRLRLIDLS
jgi:hypothetical protein